MGGAASKTARSLPKTPSSSTVSSPISLARSAPIASRPARTSEPTSSPTSEFDSKSRGDLSPLEAARMLGQAGRKTQQMGQSGRPGPAGEKNEGARDVKDEAIRRDAFDPDFISQLNSLGPVEVDQPPWSKVSPVPTSSTSTGERRTKRGEPQMVRILQARKEREEALLALQDQRTSQQSIIASSSASAASPPSSTLDGPTLSMLLDDLKSAKTISDVRTLSHLYDFDLHTLALLSRRFNSPSLGGRVDSQEEQRRRNEEGGPVRHPRMYAVWKQTDVDLTDLGERSDTR